MSPYRNEIIGARKQGVPIGKLYVKYAPLMGYTAKKESFEQMLSRHNKDGHNVEAIMMPTAPGSAVAITPATIENFGQKMLEIGMAKIENADPNKVALKDVIAAQALVLNSRKLRLTEDAMMLALGKMFAPPELNKENAVEGEVVDAVHSG